MLFKNDNKDTFVQKVNSKMVKLTGKAGALAKEFLQNKNTYGSYTIGFNSKIFYNKETMNEVLDWGLKAFFSTLLPKKTADDFCQLVLRLPDFMYGGGPYRRSYRSLAPYDYSGKIFGLMIEVYFNWEKFDLLTYLKMSDSQIKEQDYQCPRENTISQLIALEIDRGNNEIIKAVKDIILSDNNVISVKRELMGGIAMSQNKELHHLMKNLLLAAKLQEGLRQAILESADDGRIEYFSIIIETILENDLLRFSACLRAVDVWMGLGYEYSDKRVVEKLLKLGLSYLNNKEERKMAIDSKDVTEMYAAMWAESVYAIQYLFYYIEKYMKGEKHQKLVSLYFLYQTNSLKNCIKISGDYLDETDLEVLTLLIYNYKLELEYFSTKKELMQQAEYFSHLKDKTVRESHFKRLVSILFEIPQKGITLQKIPFDWCTFTLTREMVFERLMLIAAYDFDESKIEKLVECFEFGSSNLKTKFIEYFIDLDASRKHKAFLISCLKDKSMAIRIAAIKQLKSASLSEEEYLQIENLLALKTGEIRRTAIEILKNRGHEAALQSLQRLINDKEENKRLGALDILISMKHEKHISNENLQHMLSLMPIVTERESILVKNLLDAQQVQYSPENGFGLYDPGYYPNLLPVSKDSEYHLASFKKISVKKLKDVMSSLLQLIEEHKDYKFQSVNYDGSMQDEILGNLNWLSCVSKEKIRKFNFDDYVLANLWRNWQKDKKVDLFTLIRMNYCIEFADNLGLYGRRCQKWTFELIRRTFGGEDFHEFVNWFYKQKFSKLAKDIVSKLIQSKDKEEKFQIYYGVLADAFLKIPPNNWTESIYEENEQIYYYVPQKETLADAREIKHFIFGMESSDDTLLFQKKLSLCYEIGKASNMRYKVLAIADIVKAVGNNIIERNELKRALMDLDGCNNMRSYTGTLYQYAKELMDKYPVLSECVQEVVNRVIEIELKRGDTKTPVSELARSIRHHKGADTFAEILVALGDETLSRGYMYGNNYSKKEVLSSLLKTCVPDENDNAQTLKDCLGGRVTEKRLLEAAMYAPSWIGILEEYLGWEGLKCGAWYFHAHTRNSYSAEFETEVARFSPIDKEDFQRGAFDIHWFKEAYQILGEKRFKILYSCAKYISEGATHRRAQLFADAVLGKFSLEDLEKTIREKRNKDLLLSYSLVPFGSDKMSDALNRYEFIHEYLKKSKDFGAQRRESEKQAAEIALENLARNLGFADVLRFNWKMEMQKMDQMLGYFKPCLVEDVTLFLQMDKAGIADLIIMKGGKTLKSLPASLKNNPYAQRLNSVKKSLKVQFSRARESLEKAMENQDEFTFEEVLDLMDHPVIEPLINKLVFKTENRLGFLKESGLEGAEGEQIPLLKPDVLTIAHCHDLFKLGKWHDFQRFAFENQLLQPFKQIFRELYFINEDEKSEKTISRRYAGHQIQPKKTIALLKTRNWTVDYECGLQKVYYRENVIAEMYALADWFSPGEIEAPTLETVRFFERKSGKSIEMEKLNPILFSEVMRDVDLVVSVAHVGGVDPLASHSTIEMRGVIVQEAMRLIKISNITVDGKHVQIKGVHGEYSVHLGSGTVHLMGHGALHIIPVHSQHRGRIFLPFMDEDPKTAEIVSKILLLAEDSKIKDPSIMTQIY